MKGHKIYNNVKGRLLRIFVLLLVLAVGVPSMAQEEKNEKQEKREKKEKRIKQIKNPLDVQYVQFRDDDDHNATFTQKVDTFSLRERIALRTNALDWVLITPNIGVEFDILKTNWNRWAITLDLKSNFSTSHTILPRAQFRRTEVIIGAKDYFSIPVNSFFGRKGWLKSWQLYRGAFIGYHNYDMMFRCDNGHQGNGISFGISAGMMRRMMIFKNGNSLDFEIGLGLGILLTKDKKYVLNEENNTYDVVSNKVRVAPFPVPVDARIGVVYRFGRRNPDYSVTNNLRNRYYYRQDIDEAYRDYLRHRQDSLENLLAEKLRNRKIQADSTTLMADIAPVIKKAETVLQMPEFADKSSYQYIVLSEALQNANNGMKGMLENIHAYGDDPQRYFVERDALAKELDMYIGIAAQYAGVQLLETAKKVEDAKEGKTEKTPKKAKQNKKKKGGEQ